MAGIQPSLEGSLLPLVELRSQAQRTLISLLDRRPGRKCLVLDPKISGPLALVANIGVLKEHGVTVDLLLDEQNPLVQPSAILGHVQRQKQLEDTTGTPVH